MNTIEMIILKIKSDLISAFASLDEWFDTEETILMFKSSSEEKSMAEVLVQSLITIRLQLNHIEKGCHEAFKMAGSMNELRNVYEYKLDPTLSNSALDFIEGQNSRSEDIITPHRLEDVCGELRWQLYHCLHYIELLKNGEGMFYTNMSLNNKDRVDVFQYIYFLVMYIRRCCEQLKRIEKEYHLHYS